MRLSVRHATTYIYDMPMRFVTQSLRLAPASCASQQVVEWNVSAEGAEFGASFTDGAGDLVRTMTLQGPVERLELLVTGVVETIDTAGVLRDHREVISPRVYLQPTQPTAPNGALHDLAAVGLKHARHAEDNLSRAHGLAQAVTEAIAYAPGSTDAHTTAAEALERGQGVCQDHAHVMIALSQSLDMPARYVSGYLLTRDDGSPEEASHAWAEVHVPGLGWVGFDPANACCPDARYIRLGSGRDAQAAALIRGISRGGGGEMLDVSVTIGEQQTQH